MTEEEKAAALERSEKLSKFHDAMEATPPCVSCPFMDGLNEEATKSQNYGCLPEGHQLVEGLKNGRRWMCHSDESRACRGLQACVAAGIVEDNPAAVPVRYSDWYAGKATLNKGETCSTSTTTSS